MIDTVSAAALYAWELIGKIRKSINGWAVFRVLRGENDIGTLLEIRSQFEKKGQEYLVKDL